MRKQARSSWFPMRFQVAVLAILLLIPASAMSAQVLIPHITGSGGFWRDYLQVDNPTETEAFFKVSIMDNGPVIFEETYSVEPLGEKVIDLKTLVPTINSGAGVVEFDDSFQLNVRLSYENKAGGGVAEFRLTDEVAGTLGFYFSNFTPAVDWKAISITNWLGDEGITLFALGDSSVLGIQKITVKEGQKAVGLHTAWFPAVPASSIKKIIAVSAGTAELSGVTIAGNNANSFLLFTPAAAVATFTVHAGTWRGTLNSAPPRILVFKFGQTDENISGTFEVSDPACGYVDGISATGSVAGTIEGSYTCQGSLKKLEFKNTAVNNNIMTGEYIEYANGAQTGSGTFEVTRD